MTQLTPTNIVSLFETTKKEREGFVTAMINEIEEGRADAIKIHMQIKSMEDIIKQAANDERYKNLLIDAASQHGKNFEMFNSKFSIKEAGTKYDYSQCNDPEISVLESKAKDASDALKARQEFLKNLPEAGLPHVDPETGESYTLYRPSKTSTTTVSVTLK